MLSITRFGKSFYNERCVPLSWQLPLCFLSPPSPHSHTHSCQKGPNHRLRGGGRRQFRFDGLTLYQTQWIVVICNINIGVAVEYYTCIYFERNALSDDLRRSYERRRPRFPDNGLAPTLPCWMELALCSLVGLTSQEKFVQFSVFVLSLNFWPCLKE